MEKLNLSGDVAFTVCGKVVIRRIGSDTLLIPVSGPAAGGRVFPLNESALTLWNCLIEGGTVRQAAERLTEQFLVDEEKAFEDCRECLGTFIHEGLVEGKAV